MTKKITKLILNGQEYEIREYVEPGWQPGANTVAYIPLKNDLLDHSGNSVTVTERAYGSGSIIIGTYAGVDCAYFNGNYLYYDGMSNINSDNFTCSCWCQSITPADWKFLFSLNTSGDNFSDAVVETDSGYWMIYDGSNRVSSVSVTNDVWHNVVMTRDNGASPKCKLYIDGNMIYSISTNFTRSYQSGFLGSRTSYNQNWRGYISEYIVENKTWTDQEVADYYDLTKGNYGIS